MDINTFASDTPWLQPIVSVYAWYGIVLFAALMSAGWWIAHRSTDPFFPSDHAVAAGAVAAGLFLRTPLRPMLTAEPAASQEGGR